MLKNLAVYRESFIKVLTSNAANTSEPDVLFRINAYGIRTIDGVITSITSTTMFVEQSKKT
jgi:hypothetical protein